MTQNLSLYLRACVIMFLLASGEMDIPLTAEKTRRATPCQLAVGYNKKAGNKLPHLLLPSLNQVNSLCRSLKNRVMIALITEFFKQVTQEMYDALVALLFLDQIICPSCGRGCAYIFYGHYWRWLKTTDGKFYMKVQRVRCRYCGMTHAIHPDCIVPYSQIPVDTQQKIILYPVGSDEMETVLDESPDVSENDVYHVKKEFAKHWKQRLLSVGLSISTSAETLIQRSFDSFHRQFMQIRRGVNLKIFLTNTG